jgi:rfaE bifunctional protein kinase chain/domain
MNSLPLPRIRQLLAAARRTRVLVLGDVMLDQFIHGRVSRISLEAPVPVVEFEREEFMPGGAANVARNLTALGAAAKLFGVAGHDPAGDRLRRLLRGQQVDVRGLLSDGRRVTTQKVRLIAQRQQVVRLDREATDDVSEAVSRRLLRAVERALDGADAVIVGDYGKGVVTQPLLDELRRLCRARSVRLSLDPKPVHQLDLRGLSLITPNRKEAFELAAVPDGARGGEPLRDRC